MFDGVWWWFAPGGVIALIVAMGLGFWVVHGIFDLEAWARTRRSPIELAEARVASKRQHVEGEQVRTTYFVTFERRSGRRQEFEVDGPVFGLLLEGDQGILYSQGPRFVDFHRRRKKRQRSTKNR